MRLFIAFMFPEKYKALLKASVEPFLLSVDHSSHTKVENYHVTIQFLGNVPERRIGEIVRLLDMVTPTLQPVTISLTSIGLIGHHDEMIAIQVQQSDALSEVQNEIVRCMEKMNIKHDTRPYKPHITIGRLKRPNEDIIAYIKHTGAAVSFLKDTEYKADSVCLVESTLSNDGSIYRIVKSFPLGQPGV